ncbi:MAG: UbiA family prenyltransferase, partial [Haloarculaceae archaeon]
YTAHVKDGYVDFYVRGEDDDHPLTAPGCRLALAGATATFALALVGVLLAVGPGAALVTLPAWIIGYLHAPQLDLNPVTATAGYPTGIAVAVVGGYYVQAQSVSVTVAAFAAVFLVVLSGIKVIDDAQDYDYDRSIGKRTVAVVLGRRRARAFAFGLMGVGLLAVLACAAVGVFPPSAAFAPVVFGGVAALTRRADAELSTMLLIRGSYLFLAALVAATWFRPLS